MAASTTSTAPTSITCTCPGAKWRRADQVFEWPLFESRHINPIVTADPAATFVLRLVADYPDGSASGIDHYYTGGSNNRDYPLFLEQPPWSIAGVNYASCDGDGPGRAPDWNDPDFATQAVQLVAALADRYDGDPRITAVQVGLLGLWGEWHQSGCEALAPGDAVKLAVRDAYVQQFAQTPLQTRYARSIDVATAASASTRTTSRPSSAACSRYAPPLPLCDDGGDWNLEWAITIQSPEARDNWRVNPLSGESPLPAQQNVWVTRQAVIEDSDRGLPPELPRPGRKARTDRKRHSDGRAQAAPRLPVPPRPRRSP